MNTAIFQFAIYCILAGAPLAFILFRYPNKKASFISTLSALLLSSFLYFLLLHLITILTVDPRMLVGHAGFAAFIFISTSSLAFFGFISLISLAVRLVRKKLLRKDLAIIIGLSIPAFILFYFSGALFRIISFSGGKFF